MWLEKANMLDFVGKFPVPPRESDPFVVRRATTVTIVASFFYTVGWFTYLTIVGTPSTDAGKIKIGVAGLTLFAWMVWMLVWVLVRGKVSSGDEWVTVREAFGVPHLDVLDKKLDVFGDGWQVWNSREDSNVSGFCLTVLHAAGMPVWGDKTPQSGEPETFTAVTGRVVADRKVAVFGVQSERNFAGMGEREPVGVDLASTRCLYSLCATARVRKPYAMPMVTVLKRHRTVTVKEPAGKDSQRKFLKSFLDCYEVTGTGGGVGEGFLSRQVLDVVVEAFQVGTVSRVVFVGDVVVALSTNSSVDAAELASAATAVAAAVEASWYPTGAGNILDEAVHSEGE